MKILRDTFSLILGLLATAHAVQFYGNQSNIRWLSAESAHFRFHFPVEYQDQASQIVSFAEAVHDTVTSRYRIKLPNQVDMIISNSLFSNGIASPASNTMNIWLTDWDFRIRSTHNWLSDVVTHEFSHLVSMQTSTKLAPYIYGLQLSWQDYANEKVRTDASVLYPLMIFPLWFAEGTAQYESSRMGFDAWDTHRDMILRTAFLADSVLPLSQMWDFPENALGSEAGPYNQGFNLVLYIVERFGDRAIPNLWSEMARIHRVTFSEACRSVLGISEEDLYRDWKRHRLEQFTLVKDSLGALVTGAKRSHQAFWQDHPQVSGGSLWGISNMGSPWFEGALFKLPLPGDSLKSLESLPEGKRPDSLGRMTMASFAETPFKLVKPWLEKGFSVRHRKEASPLIAYVSYKNRDREGKAYFDIAIDDTTADPWLGERKTLRFATRFADAVSPDLSPDGREVVFARREANGSRFFLSIAPVPETGEGPGEMRDLVTPPPGARYQGIHNPKWSPDGQWIAFGYYDGTSRKIGLIRKDGSGFRALVADAYDNRDVAWSTDGKSILYASDRTGIFNLYKLGIQDSTASSVMLTNVSGGAFAPCADSNRIWYIGYDADGFSLYELDSAKPLPATPVKLRMVVKPQSLPIGEVELQGIQHPYRPLPTRPMVVPMIAVEGQSDPLGSIRKGEPVALAGLAVGLSDPLQKNYLQLALLLEMGKGADFIKTTGLNPDKQSQFMALLENRSFPITLNAGYMRTNSTSRDTVRSEDPRAEEPLSLTRMAIGLQALELSAGYSLFKEGDSIAVGAGMQWANFNLYEIGFAWDYHKEQRLTAQAMYFGDEQATNGASLVLVGSRNWLFRPGTFQESFTINSQGVISPVYREYTLSQGFLSGWWTLPSPIQPSAKFVFAARASGILSWTGHTSQTDTLDHFYHHSLDIAGYPSLLDPENLLLHGDRTTLGQFHYLYSLYEKQDYRWWVFSHQALQFDLFAQLGSAWWDQGSLFERLEKLGNWKRSVGLELRFSNKVFMTQPMHLWVNLSRALDKVDFKGRQIEVDRVDLPWIPRVVEPTAIAMGIGFQFSDPWIGNRRERNTPLAH